MTKKFSTHPPMYRFVPGMRSSDIIVATCTGYQWRPRRRTDSKNRLGSVKVLGDDDNVGDAKICFDASCDLSRRRIQWRWEHVNLMGRHVLPDLVYGTPYPRFAQFVSWTIAYPESRLSIHLQNSQVSVWYPRHRRVSLVLVVPLGSGSKGRYLPLLSYPALINDAAYYYHLCLSCLSCWQYFHASRHQVFAGDILVSSVSMQECQSLASKMGPITYFPIQSETLFPCFAPTVAQGCCGNALPT